MFNYCLPLCPQSTVRSLRVMLDGQLTMSSHITSLCRLGYYQLRQLRGIIQSLTPDATKTLVHAFISSRLDYCNSLLFGVTDQQLKRLQSAAVRLVTGTRRSDHITPVLKVLHWLPVRQRIQYKMAMLIYKCLNERAPEYLVTDCCWAGNRRSGTCIVVRCWKWSE